jgi:coenzyme F420-0:L-glutamate ligase/coenzyme F420-1:gamma-L-glutamate ligase
VVPVVGLPAIGAGDPLGRLIGDALAAAGEALDDGDVVVISQKVVSKAEGRVVDLGTVEPGERALELATRVGKDPRMVELILRESRRVVRAAPGVLIVEDASGWIAANAGIDSSNVTGDDRVALLPADADASARGIRAELRQASGASPAVVVADSFGRPWRLGQTDVAIGCAGLVPLDDWTGRRDLEGRELEATAIAIADEVASAADLVRAKSGGVPTAVVRGIGHFVTDEDGPGARVLQRPGADDLFR